MKAIYPGTFDPITFGHLDIIDRARHIFDELEVVIMVNPRKHCLFDSQERKTMIMDCLKEANIEHVKVSIGSGLTVDYAKKVGAKVIVRGIRAVSDYEYELAQATANLSLNDTIETMFLIAKPQYSFLSSSVSKEIAMHGGDVSHMLPHAIAKRVKDEIAGEKYL